MANVPPFTLRDFRLGRITPQTLSPFLVPENSVKDALNVNFDEIVGSGKVRAGTTEIGTGQTPGLDGFMPQGITEFSPGSGATLGSELVTNGTFTGNADGWNLGDGWAYNVNNVLRTPFGAELITNGSFTGSAAGWTLGSRWAYGTNNVHMSTGSSSSDLSQDLTGLVTLGLSYLLTFDNTDGMGGISYGVGINPGGTNGPHLTGTSQSATLVCGSTNNLLIFRATASNPAGQTEGDIDNVSLKQRFLGTLSQNIGAVSNYTYQVSVTAGGTTGYVTVDLGGVNNFVVAAGTTVTQTLQAGGSFLTITPSIDFDSTIDTVTVKQVLSTLLLVVYNGVTTATLYYWDGTTWNTSNLTTLTNDAKNRFTVFGAYAFVTNNVDGMFSSPDANTWGSGAAQNCIPAADAKPAYIFRYKQRLLAAGDPVYPDRVFFSSIIDPSSSPFITWNTNATTGDWIDVNPDDGGNITGFSETSTFALIFKNTGMYRMDTVSKTVDPDNIFNVGAVSQEAIVLCQGVTYFFSGTGVYRTNGGYPELISRNGVEDIIDAMSPADWNNVAAGTDGFNVYFELGSILFNKNQTNEKRIDNVVIKFSVRDQTWSVHAYRDYFGQFCQYTDSNGDLLRGASDAGIVQTLNLGVVDISAAIPFFLETQDVEMGDRAHQKGISDKVVVYADNGLSSSFAAKQDGGSLKQIIMSLSKRVNMGKDINLQGNWFNFIWSGTSSGNPPIFEGIKIEDIQDLGMGDAQGESDAPIVPEAIVPIG